MAWLRLREGARHGVLAGVAACAALAGALVGGCASADAQDGAVQEASSQAQAVATASGELPQVDFAYIESALGQVALVDARPFDDFAGDQAADARSGHIPGAVNMPASKLTDNQGNPIAQSRMMRIFERRSLQPSDHVVVYGSDAADVALVADQLVQNGFSNVNICTEPFEAWAADASREVEQQVESCCALPEAAAEDTQTSSSAQSG